MNMQRLSVVRGMTLCFLLILLLPVYSCKNIFQFFKSDDLNDYPSSVQGGYASFYNNGGWHFEICQVENQNIKCDAVVGSYSELKKAGKPGNHTFLIRRNNKVYSAVNVKITENAATYVTIQTPVLTYSYGKATFDFFTTEGKIPLPFEPGIDNADHLITALDVDDLGTRYYALLALKNIYKKNKKMETGAIADKLTQIFYRERYEVMRNEIKEFLDKLDKPIELNDYDIIWWDGFEDDVYIHGFRRGSVKNVHHNESGINNPRAELKPNWYTDNQKYYINAAGYNIDNNNDKSTAVFYDGTHGGKIHVELPDDFDIELTCTWKSGVNRYPYGLILSKEKDSYYSFGIARNGAAAVSLQQNNKISFPLQWKSVPLTGSKTVLKVEVRGNTMTYYVNGNKAGAVDNDAKLKFTGFGMTVQDKQAICFNLLKIIKK